MLATGGSEGVAEELPERVAREPGADVVGTDELGAALHRHPVAARVGDDGGGGARAEVRELPAAATRDAHHRVTAAGRMGITPALTTEACTVPS